MMDGQVWSWALSIVGMVGFILAGKKVWWAWYINIANQVLWYAYAVVTEQLGFIVAATFYTIIFSKNAISWTRDHFEDDDSPYVVAGNALWCWGQQTLHHPKCIHKTPHEPHYVTGR